MKRIYKLASALGLLIPMGTMAQCPAGQLEVTIDVSTDNWGYECYWELLPVGNACGTGTIFAGGNTAVGCSGGGAQAQTPGGYGNNTTITEGAWCLTEGADYDIFSVDDWGDDHSTYDVVISGLPIYTFDGTGNTNRYTFTVAEPPNYDMGVTDIHLYSYVNPGMVDITGTIRNLGSQTITDFDLYYQIDGGSNQTDNITGVSIAPYTDYEFTHSIQYNAMLGWHGLTVWAGNLNGGNLDEDNSNDSGYHTFEVGDPVPNYVDTYLTATPTFTTISSAGDNLDNPRDLDFHPHLSRMELWVVNKNTEGSGGSTTTYWDAGEAGQTSLWKRDGNAWHFMSLPTGIAFGENGNFANSPGVFDANHDGGGAFTGPALWSSDMSIYAEPSGGNGSHLDMLHVSPYSQGIAHEVDNVYWVVDGYSNDIVRYNFNDDHGPGNSDHGDAEIYRYNAFSITKDPGNHIVSHCELDKATGWLYVVDHGGQRVLRLDINTGTLGSTPTYGPFETIADYKYVTGYTWEVVVNTGLTEPAGVDVIDDRMIVSDHSNGDILIYDISAMPATLLGTISTGAPGVMGVTIGPEGRIWYVNTTTEEVVVINAGGLGIEDTELDVEASVYPNPSNGAFSIKVSGEFVGDMNATITDALGRTVYSEQWSMNGIAFVKEINEALEQGTYFLHLESEGNSVTEPILISE